MPAERDAVVTACAADLFFRFVVFWGVSLADILVLICNIQNRKTNFEIDLVLVSGRLVCTPVLSVFVLCGVAVRNKESTVRVE